jgi:medium-chain acyl-[acyl-carrier-protein] hydrolase
MNRSSWFSSGPVDPRARLRMFCFPHAGSGAAVFHDWPVKLSDRVDVRAIHLPGREVRLREQPYTRAEASADAIAEALEERLDLPFAFFGHSMGALLCFEVARALRRRGLPEPGYLFVSGHRAPQIPSPRPAVFHLPEAEFLEALQDLYDPPEAAWKIPELRALLLPTLRADITLCETYEYSSEPPLDCPIVAFGGRDDQETPIEALQSWRMQTRAGFEMKRFEGGHFYLEAALPEILEIMDSKLETMLDSLPESAANSAKVGQ